MQMRKCKQGHVWTLVRRHQMNADGNGFMSWTDGTLECPHCGGHAVWSSNCPPGCIMVSDEQIISENNQ